MTAYNGSHHRSSRKIKFARQKALVTDKAPRWAKKVGLGASGQTITAIAKRSNPREPWTWTECESVDAMAVKLRIPRRTLMRHLAILRDAGVVEGEVRASDNLRTNREVVLYRLTTDAVEAILAWDEDGGDPDPWGPIGPHGGSRSKKPALSANLPLRKGQGGTKSPSLDTAGNPCGTRAEQRSAPPFLATEGIKKKLPNGRRRLRQRTTISTSTKEVTVRYTDDYEPPIIGMPTGVVTLPQRSPVTEMGNYMAETWAKLPGRIQMRTHSQPWAVNGKGRFNKWLKEDYLPQFGGNLDRAKQVWDLWLAEVAVGGTRIPDVGGRAPAHSFFASAVPALMHKTVSLAEQMEAVAEAKARQAAPVAPLDPERRARLQAKQAEDTERRQRERAERRRRNPYTTGSYAAAAEMGLV